MNRNPRTPIFLAFAAIHLALFLFGVESLAPVLAGSLYLPLMAFNAIGMPVFTGGQSGGWAAPSMLGWLLSLLVWTAVWWIVSGLVARYMMRGSNKA